MSDTSLTLEPQAAIQRTLTEALVGFRLRNPSFSLRAMARKLTLSPAALSEILSGKRPVTRKVAQRIVSRLALDPRRAKELVEMFPEKRVRQNVEVRLDENAPQVTDTNTQLTMDQFHAIADWYHFAILSLSETEGFKDDPRWVAARLRGVKIPEARAALDRLERLGMLKRTSNGKRVPTGLQYTTSDDITHLALRRAHSQYLDLSRNVLDEVDTLLRDFIGVTMAIDLKRVPEAKKMIRRFLSQASTRLETGRRSEVYQLNVQLIPLSHLRQGQKEIRS